MAVGVDSLVVEGGSLVVVEGNLLRQKMEGGGGSRRHRRRPRHCRARPPLPLYACTVANPAAPVSRHTLVSPRRGRDLGQD